VGLDDRRLALGQQAAEVQHVHVVADAQHERHVVLDEQDGQRELAAQHEQPVAELVGLVGAHAGRRLVEQQDVGVGGQGAAELEQLERAVGLPAHAHVADALQAQQVQDGVGALLELALGAQGRGRADSPLPTS
jgi:hypothetical protein